MRGFLILVRATRGRDAPGGASGRRPRAAEVRLPRAPVAAARRQTVARRSAGSAATGGSAKSGSATTGGSLSDGGRPASGSNAASAPSPGAAVPLPSMAASPSRGRRRRLGAPPGHEDGPDDAHDHDEREEQEPGDAALASSAGSGVGVGVGTGVGVGAGVGAATATSGTTTSAKGLPPVTTGGGFRVSHERPPSVTSDTTTYLASASTSATLNGTENGIGALTPACGRASKPSTLPVSGWTTIVTEEASAPRAPSIPASVPVTSPSNRSGRYVRRTTTPDAGAPPVTTATPSAETHAFSPSTIAPRTV